MNSVIRCLTLQRETVNNAKLLSGATVALLILGVGDVALQRADEGNQHTTDQAYRLYLSAVHGVLNDFCVSRQG